MKSNFINKFIDKIINDPRIQLTIHTWGFWYWLINFFACSILFFCFSQQWATWGLFITLIYSIYANFATDYGSMSSAQACINTENSDAEIQKRELDRKKTESIIHQNEAILLLLDIQKSILQKLNEKVDDVFENVAEALEDDRNDNKDDR